MKNNRWLRDGLLLGAVFFLAVWIVKPVGVSTQFSVLSGIIHSSIDKNVILEDSSRESGYISSNEYYDKNEGRLAAEIKKPWNYGFVFVLAIPLGAYIGYVFNGKRKKSEMPDVGENRNLPKEKQSFINFYGPSFMAGFIMLYGARMAGGCTSGHMMSGMMQGSVSGYVFAAAVFATAIPTAIFIGNAGRKSGGAK